MSTKGYTGPSLIHFYDLFLNILVIYLEIRSDMYACAYIARGWKFRHFRLACLFENQVSSISEYDRISEKNQHHPPKRVVTALVDGAFWAHESPGSWPTTVETYSNVFSQSDFRFNKGKYDTHDSAGSTSMAPGAAEPWQP